MQRTVATPIAAPHDCTVPMRCLRLGFRSEPLVTYAARCLLRHLPVADRGEPSREANAARTIRRIRAGTGHVASAVALTCWTELGSVTSITVEKGTVMHVRMTGGPLGPSQENRYENTSHCCRFWSRCGVARFRQVRERTPSKIHLVRVERPPAMGAPQPKQFRYR